jgi:rubredoxin
MIFLRTSDCVVRGLTYRPQVGPSRPFLSHLTGKAGFNKIDISCLGPQCAYRYFSEDATDAVVFRLSPQIAEIKSKQL